MDSMESEHELLIPIVDKENICLPLSINAVAKYWNVELPLSEAVEISKKYPNVTGSILIEGIELAERHGLGTLILHSSLKELKKIIDMGIPPIVILPGLHDIVQHASVISGYDDSEKTILHYVPQSTEEGGFQGSIPEKQFDELWSEDGRLLIILAPIEIISDLKLENLKTEKSNRLCFFSEKLNLQKKSDEAISKLTEAIRIDEKNSTAFSLLASILNEKNDSKCLEYYKKSLELNKKNFLAYRGLGNYYLKNKQYEKAEEYYTNAIKINPIRFGPIYKNRGISRLEQNKKSEAKQDLNDYLKFTPNAKDKQSITQAINEL